MKGLQTMAQRIMALWFPRLATDRIMRRRLGRSWRLERLEAAPLVVSRQENNTRRIAALDERAETLGLKRGTGIADARAMHPSINIVEDDPEADRRLLDALADWCDRYTPLVAIEGTDGLF
ncbi:MAG: DNA polymerase Y family protein, partial [Rhizobiaceae bacterium]